MTIKLFSAAIAVIFIFSGCSKNSNNNTGGGNGGTSDSTKSAYSIDLSTSYSSGSGTWAKAIRIQKDGKILVLGYQWFIRLEKDGVTLDQTFKPITEIASSAFVNSLELQDDGKIIVFGKFVLSNGRKAIARLNADGSLDASFNQPVLDINYQEQAINIHAIKLLANGKMVIAGALSYKTLTGYGNGIIRLNADQSLDYSFVSPISAADVYNVTSMLALSDGSFLLAGYGAITASDKLNYAIIKINADGVQDKSFIFDHGGTLNVSSFVAGELKELASGQLLVSWLPAAPQDQASHVARLNTDGSVDAGFAVYDVGGIIRALAVQPDNSIWVGNEPDGNLPYEKKYLIYLTAAGKEDTASTLKFGNSTGVECLANVDASTVLVGGGLYYNNTKYAILKLTKNK